MTTEETYDMALHLGADSASDYSPSFREQQMLWTGHSVQWL